MAAMNSHSRLIALVADIIPSKLIKFLRQLPSAFILSSTPLGQASEAEVVK